MSWPRTSYQARVLLVPLDIDARAWAADREPGALAGIAIAPPALLEARHTAVLAPRESPGAGGRGTGSPEGRAVSSPLDHAVHDADVVVMFTHDLAAVDRGSVIAVADSARPSGTLLGAVVVSPGARWSDPAAAAAITTVREVVDNVVILKDDRFVVAFLQVLRGGVQDAEPGEVNQR